MKNESCERTSGAAFPKTEVQRCIVHQIRNSIRHVASKNQKEYMRDLKPAYQAATQDAVKMALDELEEKWGAQYPVVIQSWQHKWHLLSAYFKYPPAFRKIIYPINAGEAVHRQFRKLMRNDSFKYI